MMEAIQVHQVIAKEGQVTVTGLPFKTGQAVDVIVLPRRVTTIKRTRLTVRQLRQSGLIGLWKNHDNIIDSAVYARQLREQVQQRGHINYE
ncbi:MAG: hypothetical protein VSS75_021995 [Candidatus Parabeggiatoa sp.]|nr:hypothetical protein [Candidatus Parabeggiatoa sp.]